MPSRSVARFLYFVLIYLTTQPLVPHAHTTTTVSYETVQVLKEIAIYLVENPELTNKLMVLLQSLTGSPTASPTGEPTSEPTDKPTELPTGVPTEQPTFYPSHPSQCYIGEICVDTEDCCPEGLDPSELGITCSRISHPDESTLVEACCIKHNEFGCGIDDDCCGEKSICFEGECWSKARQRDEGI